MLDVEVEVESAMNKSGVLAWAIAPTLLPQLLS
jgi:hypothetical protein